MAVSRKIGSTQASKRAVQKKKDGKGAAKKESFFVRARRFLEGVGQELKKVHWPTRRETIIYTAVVLVSVTAVGILIWIFDSILSQLLRLIIS